MNITSLGLHITNRCNARCLHCAFWCGPEIEDYMRLEEAKQYVTDAKALNTEIVCITGGEPMLYPDLVKVSLRKIIEEYDYQDFAVIAALHDDGMEGIMNLASKNGFVPKEGYINGCHFCYEARRFLKKDFPEALVLPTTVFNK